MPQRHLFLGAARSGKTRLAIERAKSLSILQQASVTYVATAQALDNEMQRRIELHRAERPAVWSTLEVPYQLGSTLAQRFAHEDDRSIVIIDCMTLWLSNAMLNDFNETAPTAALSTWQHECADFLAWLQNFSGHVLIVTNEVGAGIVPASALARRFQDEQGRLNQSLAEVCERVTLVVAGIEVAIKEP